MDSQPGWSVDNGNSERLGACRNYNQEMDFNCSVIMKGWIPWGTYAILRKYAPVDPVAQKALGNGSFVKLTGRYLKTFAGETGLRQTICIADENGSMGFSPDDIGQWPVIWLRSAVASIPAWPAAKSHP